MSKMRISKANVRGSKERNVQSQRKVEITGFQQGEPTWRSSREEIIIIRGKRKRQR
jgi:hypothetical protein